jgi:hypothetical protein
MREYSDQPEARPSKGAVAIGGLSGKLVYNNLRSEMNSAVLQMHAPNERAFECWADGSLGDSYAQFIRRRRCFGEKTL